MAQQTIQIADKPTLDEVKALLENSGYGLEAIKSALGGGIKSVQRGIYRDSLWANSGNPSDDGLGFYVDVNISSVNMEKSIVITQSPKFRIYPKSENYLRHQACCRLVNSNTLRLYQSGIDYTNAGGCTVFCFEHSWQVIEFE